MPSFSICLEFTCTGCGWLEYFWKWLPRDYCSDSLSFCEVDHSLVFLLFFVIDLCFGRYDRARGVEIGNKDIKLEHLEEAFTTSNWIVRIYKVKPPNNRWWNLSFYWGGRRRDLVVELQSWVLGDRFGHGSKKLLVRDWACNIQGFWIFWTRILVFPPSLLPHPSEPFIMLYCW